MAASEVALVSYVCKICKIQRITSNEAMVDTCPECRASGPPPTLCCAKCERLFKPKKVLITSKTYESRAQCYECLPVEGTMFDKRSYTLSLPGSDNFNVNDFISANGTIDERDDYFNL